MRDDERRVAAFEKRHAFEVLRVSLHLRLLGERKHRFKLLAVPTKGKKLEPSTSVVRRVLRLDVCLSVVARAVECAKRNATKKASAMILSERLDDVRKEGRDKLKSFVPFSFFVRDL